MIADRRPMVGIEDGGVVFERPGPTEERMAFVVRSVVAQNRPLPITRSCFRPWRRDLERFP